MTRNPWHFPALRRLRLARHVSRTYEPKHAIPSPVWEQPAWEPPLRRQHEAHYMVVTLPAPPMIYGGKSVAWHEDTPSRLWVGGVPMEARRA